jgi:hypothetical protein
MSFSLVRWFLLKSSNSVVERCLMFYVALAIVCKKKNERKLTRSKWPKDWLLDRSFLSDTNLLHELKLDPGDWFNHLRMYESTYLELLQEAITRIDKSDTFIRTEVTPHERISNWQVLRRYTVCCCRLHRLWG